MKSPRVCGLLILMCGLQCLVGQVNPTDLKPDSDGYIRDWLMLAPVVIPDADTCAEALLKEQVRGENQLKPKAGDKVKVGGKELVWTPVNASTNHVDLNQLLKTMNDHAGGYLVTYIEADQEVKDVVLAVASNDQGRIYFNGVDIYAYTEARPLMLDADKGRITLKKGLNVMVFKILNEQNSWQAAMRLLDKTGAPLQGVRIKLSP